MAPSDAPAQLPADVRAFTGRDAELAALDALLLRPAAASGHPPAVPDTMAVCAVTGPGGVGKTALVVRWAHRVRDQFPDGQLYVDLRGYDPDQPVTASTALAGLLFVLGAGPDIPADTEARAGAYRSLLDGRRILVVLDNAVSAAQVRPLLPGTPLATTVITSRDLMAPLTVEGAHTLQLEPLSPAESHLLLAGRLGTGRVAAEPAAAQQITTACAGLPLALVVVAARAATSPSFALSVLADELAETGRRLDAMTAGDALSDVRAAFSWSYQELPVLAARAWRQLSLHPGPDLAAPAAASLTGLTVAAVRPLLATLTQANLIAEHQPGRFAFHDLLREYATELARGTDAVPQRAAAVRRLLDHYVHTAHAAARRMYPAADPILLPLTRPSSGAAPVDFEDSDQARKWFADEHQALLSAQRLAADSGHHALAWQLAWSMSGFLDRGGHQHDRLAAWEAALAAAEHLGHHTAQAHALRSLGHALLLVGGDDAEVDSHLGSALRLFAAAGSPFGEGETHRMLVSICHHRGQYDQALDHAHRALACYETIGHKFGQASSYNAIGWTLALLGDYAEALVWAQRALPLQQDPRDDLGAAATWDTVGYIQHQLGQDDQAADSYRHALELIRALGGDRSEEASITARLGDALAASGQRDAAAAVWQQALDLFTETDDLEAAGVRDRLAQLDG